MRLACGRGFNWVAGEETEVVEYIGPTDLSRFDSALGPDNTADEETDAVEPKFEERGSGGAMTDEGARTAGFCSCSAALSFT